LIGHGGSEAEGLVPGFGYLKIAEPHNDFLRILFAYGVVGLGLYLSLVFAFLISAIRLRLRKDYFHKNLGNLMIVIIAMILLLSLTNQPMLYPSAALYFYAFGSTVLFASHQHSKIHNPLSKPS
jgi:O-antigen ligase